MKQSSNIQRGFLFDYKWIPVLRDLDSKDFHTIFWQLLDFQQSNGTKKVPRHRGRRDLDHIANLIVPQIENRLNGALGGRPPQRPSPQEGGSNPGSNPPLKGGMEGGLGAKISQDKISQVKISQVESGAPAPPALGGTSAPCGADAAQGGAQTQEKQARRHTQYARPQSGRRDQGGASSFDMDTFFADAVRKSLGE